VVWDSDMASKDYLGEAAVALEDRFGGHPGGARGAHDHPNNNVRGVQYS
jgi:hypothetical protein